MNIKRIAVIVFACAGLLCRNATAQQEAIPAFTLGGVVGYANNGAGFAFSPNVNIGVTALGYAGGFNSDLLSEPCQVSLFDSGGNLLASQTITTGSTFYNQSYYDAISTIQLIAGQTYYLGAVGLNNGQNFWLGSAVGGGFTGSYSVDSDITYLYGVNGIMPPGTLPGNSQGSVYLVGVNFMFTTATPEPGSLCLLGLGGMLACVWRTIGVRRR
jgi:PEP-CTERM motif